MPSLHDVDLAVLAAITAPANRYPLFDLALGALHRSMMLKSGVLVAALCWLWAEALRRGSDAQRLVSRMILATFTAIAAGRVLQMALPPRLRPIADADIDVTWPANALAVGDLRDWSSMPSDHAVYLVAISTALCFRSRALGAAALLWSTLIALLPRIYFGKHYPSDIAVGTAIGATIAVVAMRAPMPAGLLDLPWRLAARHPAPFYAAAVLVATQMSTMFVETREWLARAGRLWRMLSGGP